MSMSLLKIIHISCAVISYTLFFLRGIWVLNESAIRRQRWVAIAPHIVDTLLLTSAVALAFRLHQYPFVNDWLTAKIFALLLYIGLGSFALKQAKNNASRVLSWLAAQAVFAYIVLVAINHSPLPF